MFISFDDLTNVLLIITVTLFIIQLVYLLFVYNIHFLNRNKVSDETITPPLSVIIVARNSIEDIRSNLKAILEQDYPDFEVIVVYEQGEKMLEVELTRLQHDYNNLYHTFIPESAKYISHKKLGQTIGIKASKNDIIVLTESNAYPTSNQWLRKIASNFSPETDFVIGYSNYEKRKGWQNRKIIFDRLQESMRFLGLAIDKMPYTASGYNLAYRKEVFYKNNGFNKFLKFKRGEDDLFVNQHANAENCRVELSEESVIRINHPSNKIDWEQEKLSTYITKKYYKGAGKYISGFDTTSKFLFFISAVGTAVFSFLSFNWILFSIALGTLLLHFIIQVTVFLNVCSKLSERRYILTLPLFNLYQPLLNIDFIIKKKLTNKKDFLRR